jgi:GntR family transcriptional regulator
VGDVIDYDGPTAVYQQLAAILRRKIERGEIPPGRAIPSKRTLTQTYGVSGMTVDRATTVLKDEGLIVFAPGRGLYVAPRPQ